MKNHYRQPKTNPTPDPAHTVESQVNHPPHYKAAGIEAIDVIEAFGLGFNLGNAIKYILRADRKGAALNDLAKANWYLERELKNRVTQATGNDPRPPK